MTNQPKNKERKYCKKCNKWLQVNSQQFCKVIITPYEK